MKREDILNGLQEAKERGLISPTQGNQDLEQRVKLFLNLLADNVPVSDAATQAGISMALVEKLADLGKSSTSASSPSTNFLFFPFPIEIKPFK